MTLLIENRLTVKRALAEFDAAATAFEDAHEAGCRDHETLDLLWRASDEAADYVLGAYREAKERRALKREARAALKRRAA